MMIQLVDVQEHDPLHLLAAVEVTDDEGTVQRVAYFMPKDAAEWRVAEYELDPEDHDTIIDVLLHEGHVQADLAPEDTLHLAPSVAHAREALLGAVQARKADTQKVAARGKANPEAAVRQRMRDLFVIEPEVVEAKRAFVQMLREEGAAGRAPQLASLLKTAEPASDPTSAASRAAVFHQAIAMNRSNRGNLDD